MRGSYCVIHMPSILVDTHAFCTNIRYAKGREIKKESERGGEEGKERIGGIITMFYYRGSTMLKQ